MGEMICTWMWEKMPGLIEWAGGLSEWQLIAAAVGLLLLVYALWTAAWNAWLVIAGMSGRIISAPTPWDDEPYEEWMAEEYVHEHNY